MHAIHIFWPHVPILLKEYGTNQYTKRAEYISDES